MNQEIRLKIDLAYRGAGFHGWQQQAGLRTVQGVLAGVAGRLLERSVVPFGAGRTDTGVHARGQVCHLAVANSREAVRLQLRLPRMTPGDLQVLAVRPVGPTFHARFSARSRRYSYHLLFRRDVFREPFALVVPYELDRQAMTTATSHLLGTHDFTSFCKKVSVRPDSNDCRVDLCQLEWREDSAILHVRADRFLHHMVRNLVGTLLEVGRGRRRAEDIPAILAARDRNQAGGCAPARGLFLEEVLYPAELLETARLEPLTADDARDGDGSEGDAL